MKGAFMIQVHGKFKLFAASYESENDLNALLRQVETWIRDNKVAPKSIGIEFLEKSNTLIMSIGYRDDESYPVSLQVVKAGKLDSNFVFDKNERDIATAVQSIERIICHELFVTGDDDLSIIFMCKL